MLIQSITLNSVNFDNLAIFICHLLVGGQFQEAQLVYSPGSLDYHLWNDIQNSCPEKISWSTIDITQSRNLQWNITTNSTHFIQLIFLGDDQAFVARQLEQLHPNYYRIFIFDSLMASNFESGPATEDTINSITNSIALFHDSVNSSFRAHLMNNDHSLISDEIQVINQSETVSSNEVFKFVFGKREDMRVFGISNSFAGCFRSEINTYLFSLFATKFFFNQTKMSFIKRGNCDYESTSYFRFTSKPVYGPLSSEMTEISVPESIQNSANIFYLNPVDRWYDRNKLPNNITLNRIYRDDILLSYAYEKYLIVFRPSLFMLLASGWIYIILIVSAMIILFFLRHGDLNRTNILISVYMDITIALTGASSLRYENYLEKIFFMILLFGVFLINTIALENVLFYCFLTEEPDRMDSFEKFAELNPPTIMNGFPVEILRSKVNVDTKFVEFQDILQNNSYGFVVFSSQLENFQSLIKTFIGKESDVLPEYLAENYNNYSLSYNGIIPKVLVEDLNRAITSHLESGIESFQSMYADFLSQVMHRVSKGDDAEDDDQPKALRLNQFKLFFVIYFIQILIAIGSFIAEIFVHRYRSRRVNHV